MRWHLHDIGMMNELRPAWDGLNSASSNLPILDSEFFLLLLKEYGNGSEKLVICESSTGLVAATILTMTRFGAWQTFQPSQAPLGAWVQSLSVSLRELLESLTHALRPMAVLVSVTQLDPDIVSRPSGSLKLQTLDHIETARITLDGTFEDYWSQRGKNLLKNMKRQRNRLSREGVTTSCQWVDDVAHVGPAVDDYGELESRGWKSEEGTAIHASNSQGRFYRALLERYSGRGEGLVLRYLYDDTLVASDLCLSRDGVFILLKTTYDEDQRTTSPSYLLRQESIERMFEVGTFKRLEFFGRVMDWHTRWASEFRKLYHVNYFRWAAAAKLHAVQRRW